MIKIELRLVGSLAGFAGKSEVAVALDGNASVRSLFETLEGMFGAELQRALVDPEMNDPRPRNLILVNGVEISLLEELDTKLKDHDVVTIVPVTHGG